MRLLALEWNDDEARLVVAESRGEGVTIEQAFAVSLKPRQPDAEQAEVNVGERIAAALAARAVGRIDALVAVSRSDVEMRQFSLPPAPDEELPELVRFQAMREFGALEDDWPLDFVPLDGLPDQPRKVLAAAVDPQLVERMRQTCQTAGVKPRRMILRPGAAASLLCRHRDTDDGKVRLLVDVLADEADLTVIVDRKAVFVRTARLSGDPLEVAEHARVLLAEIRRTMVAAQNQLGGRRIDSISVCGSGPRNTALAARIEKELLTPTSSFDPLSGLTLGRELRSAPPDRPDRFAPLLGMVLDELDRTPHAIDFLNPRRPPRPVSQRKKYATAGLAVAFVVALLMLWDHLEKRALEREIQDLTAQSASWDEPIKRATKLGDAADEIGGWTDAEVAWLVELRRLSDKFPPAKQAMLTQLLMGPSSHGGEMRGEMRLEGLSQSAADIDAMEKALRDSYHGVEGKGRSQDDSRKFYSWRFDSSLFISREDRR